MKDNSYYVDEAQKRNQFANGALDNEINSTIRGRALIGGICMAVPLFGVETIIYAICLWSTYAKIASLCGVPFKDHIVKNVIGGFIINIIATFVLGCVLDIVPIIGWIGSFIVGFASFYISGKAFVKMLKKLHG